MQNLKRAALAAVLATSLTLAACGGPGGEENGDGLAPGDYTIASAEGVKDSVVVNGKIAPVRAVSITTPLQSEVERIAVAPGDRVQAEQFLAEMNTEQLQRQLAIQERQQANAQAEAMSNVEQAQAQLNALNESINNGTHPAIRAAQAQVSQAQAAYNAAVGAGGRVASRVASRVSEAFGAYLPDMPQMPGMPQAPGQAPAPAPEQPAPVEPAPGVPAPGAPEYVEPAYSADQAYAALESAKADLAAARAQAEQERMQLQAQVDSAWRMAESAQLEASDGTLEYQVQEATIYAPIAGMITSVDVQEGDIPQGRILSIADDSRLLIRTDVREADVPSIAAGNRVVFTSTATGKKEYTGRVTRISPAGASGGAGVPGGMPEMAAQGEDGSVTFPVEIEVTGSTEGLLLGGSVRAEIITSESEGINVPVDAVYEDDGKDKVLVLASDGSTTGTVEEREVKTGAANDVDVAITGGDLKAGDIVINWPDDYRDRIGQTVSITDPNFDAGAVDEARQQSERTTTTVTVTSTRRAADAS